MWIELNFAANVPKKAFQTDSTIKSAFHLGHFFLQIFNLFFQFLYRVCLPTKICLHVAEKREQISSVSTQRISCIFQTKGQVLTRNFPGQCRFHVYLEMPANLDEVVRFPQCKSETQTQITPHYTTDHKVQDQFCWIAPAHSADLEHCSLGEALVDLWSVRDVLGSVRIFQRAQCFLQNNFSWKNRANRCFVRSCIPENKNCWPFSWPQCYRRREKSWQWWRS